jgi:hypothetical protein
MRTEEEPEPSRSQWPDSIGFWFAITFAVIAVSVLLCGGGYWLLRRFF